jgi:NAD(P)-dependent dehydrogenase (short-subunit alcohol dehydrogenase family)
MTRTIQQLLDLKGRTALVTGGSRGLGLQMAHALGEAGARIMLTSRKAGDLEEAAAQLQAAGIDARWIAADCGKEEDIRRLADETLTRMGDVDILVNNAGAAWGAPAEDHPVEAWDKLMNLNVRGYFILSQQIAKRSMIGRKYGRIINIASIAGKGYAGTSNAAYAASKGAVISLTKTAAQQLAKHNITVNSVCPGVTRTGLSDANLRVRAQQEGVSLEEMERRRAEDIPLQRANDPEDIAAMVVFLASAGARNITGQSFNVDGGLIPD